MPAINENLRFLRHAKGMTQAEVAEAISVARQTVSSYESGRTQPDLDTLKRLSQIYQADLQDILYEGNRLQRRLKRIKLAAYTLVAIALMGVLLHSAVFFVMNEFFWVASGSGVTSVVEMRFVLRDFAETFAGVCTGVFTVGCIVMASISVTVAEYIRPRYLIAFFATEVLFMLCCSVPFGMADRHFALVNYLSPVFSGIVVSLLCLTTILVGHLVSVKKTRKT